jgi:hypothetical protein
VAEISWFNVVLLKNLIFSLTIVIIAFFQEGQKTLALFYKVANTWFKI